MPNPSPHTFAQAVRLRRRDVPTKSDPAGRNVLAWWSTLGYSPDESVTTAFTRARASELRSRLENRYSSNGCKGMFSTYLAIWRHWRDMRDPSLPDAPHNRSFKFRPEAPRSPTALSVEQLGALLCAIDDASLMNVVERADWKALILVLYYTGARIEMVRSATRKQYDPETGRLTMIVSKGGQPRVWELPQDCRDAIRQSWFFQKRCSRQLNLCRQPGTHYMLKRIAKHCGLDGIVRGFHIFRRTSVTHVAAKQGVAAAAEHVGHGDIKTTLKYYVDPRFVPVRTYSQILRSPLRTPEPVEFGSDRPEDSIDDEEVLFNASEGVAPGSPDV